MATYVYRCPQCGSEVEEIRSIQLGPRQGSDAPLCSVCSDLYGHAFVMRNVIFTSTIQFGNQQLGDDDFSRRYWPNGVNEASKPNRTQGQTNINGILRKYGEKGMPLALRKDIDPDYMTSKPLPQFENSDLPAGMVPATPALTPKMDLVSTADLK